MLQRNCIYFYWLTPCCPHFLESMMIDVWFSSCIFSSGHGTWQLVSIWYLSDTRSGPKCLVNLLLSSNGPCIICTLSLEHFLSYWCSKRNHEFLARGEGISEGGISDIQNREMEKYIAFDKGKGERETRNWCWSSPIYFQQLRMGT